MLKLQLKIESIYYTVSNLTVNGSKVPTFKTDFCLSDTHVLWATVGSLVTGTDHQYISALLRKQPLNTQSTNQSEYVEPVQKPYSPKGMN